MSNEIKNIFISHRHEDDGGLPKLTELLAKHGLEARDASITSYKPNQAKNPDYIKSLLGNRIEWCSTLVVYVSPQTKDSEWVDWEIERAHALGKRIVGVWAHGANNCEIPAALDRYRDAMVGWSGENIVDAITGQSNDSYDSAGQLMKYRPIKRFKC